MKSPAGNCGAGDIPNIFKFLLEYSGRDDLRSSQFLLEGLFCLLPWGITGIPTGAGGGGKGEEGRSL